MRFPWKIADKEEKGIKILQFIERVEDKELFKNMSSSTL